MSEKIVQLNEEVIKGQIKELVRGSVEETLNELLEKEAESLTQAARYERNEARQGYRSGHYDRNLTTTSLPPLPNCRPMVMMVFIEIPPCSLPLRDRISVKGHACNRCAIFYPGFQSASNENPPEKGPPGWADL